jgi:hypothetical protein
VKTAKTAVLLTDVKKPNFVIKIEIKLQSSTRYLVDIIFRGFNLNHPARDPTAIRVIDG